MPDTPKTTTPDDEMPVMRLISGVCIGDYDVCLTEWNRAFPSRWTTVAVVDDD
jgi:hypothetical protein